MTNNFKHSVSIEQFIANEMAPAERIAFQKEMRSNPALAEELRLSQGIDAAISREDVLDLRQKLLTAIEAGRTQKAEVPVVRMSFRKIWYAAASVIVLVAVSATLYLQSNRSVSNESLFSQYYSAENIVDQTRSDENLVEAVIKFQEKDFAAASSMFKSILDKDSKNIAVWFYYGIANIETQHYNKSIEAFTTIIEHNDNLYIEHAEWYLGLCYLKNNQKDKAIDQFVAVASNDENFHNKEAKKILEKLQLK